MPHWSNNTRIKKGSESHHTVLPYSTDAVQCSTDAAQESAVQYIYNTVQYRFGHLLYISDGACVLHNDNLCSTYIGLCNNDLDI